MFEFQYPYFFILLFLPPMVFMLFKPGGNDKGGIPAIYNPNLKWLTRSYGKKPSEKGGEGKFNILLYVIWALLVCALMHPQSVEKISKTTAEGYDIMLAVDLSKSMMAFDLTDMNSKRNRLDVVKQVASNFIKGRPGDRIGLILFGDTAYLQTPLTMDGDSVIEMLNFSEIGMAGDATAIGDAIALAVKSLIQRPEGSRIIILLTDGSNSAGVISPIEASKLAKEYGIKIYSIGIGREGVVPFPTESGGIAYAKINMDEKALRKISDETGGAYFNASDESSLKEIYKKIDELEKTETKTSESILRKQLYKYPLSVSMIILIYLIIMRYNWSKFFK